MCDPPEGFVGGGRKIVDDSYCDEKPVVVKEGSCGDGECFSLEDVYTLYENSEEKVINGHIFSLKSVGSDNMVCFLQTYVLPLKTTY